MDRIQRALDLSRRQRLLAPGAGLSLAERPELLRQDGIEPQPDAEPVASPESHDEALSRLQLDPDYLARRRVVRPTDRGPVARAYRMLRAQVLQRVRARGLRSIGIVSAVAGEGKTLTAINLAMSLAAEPNQNVALVDLDFRHPSIAHTLGVTPERGLDGWLYDGSPLSSSMYQLEGVERLQLVPTLVPVAASSEALASARVRELMVRLRARHESQLLVVDQPPALLSDDVLTLSPLIDGYLLVITESKTLRDDVERVFELLGRDRLIGTVLNGSSDSEQRAY
jgi:Mrp family chromosome partitioning ATPase